MQDETAHTDKEFELGVLFIHGIGTQARGQTLATFGGPLFRWIQSRCEALDLARQKEAEDYQNIERSRSDLRISSDGEADSRTLSGDSQQRLFVRGAQAVSLRHPAASPNAPQTRLCFAVPC